MLRLRHLSKFKFNDVETRFDRIPNPKQFLERAKQTGDLVTERYGTWTRAYN